MYLVRRYLLIVVSGLFLIILFLLYLKININDEKPKEIVKLIDETENIIKPWSFLRKIYQDTRIESYCKVRNEKWRNKLVKINNYNLNFNVFGSDDIVSENIYRYGTWESSNIQTILIVLKKTSIKRGIDISFLDIGANIGWFTTIIANWFNSNILTKLTFHRRI